LGIIKNEYKKAIIHKEERERSFLLENATERYQNFTKDFPVSMTGAPKTDLRWIRLSTTRV